MNDNVVVTGGAGFVGSSLVRRLLDQDYSVTVIDNLLRGSRENLPTDDRLNFVEGDIRSGSDLAAAMAFKPNYVVHLAAQHFIPYCNEHPGDTIHVNVYGTQNILDAIADSNCVDKLIFASTAAVYAPSDKPHTEDEVYYIVSGRSKFHVEGEVANVLPGDVIFVKAHADHRFYDITEDLLIVVFFAPAEGSAAG